MKLEKTIVVEKSTKWWMGAVAASSLAVGTLGGFGIGALVYGNQSTTTTQASQVGQMPSMQHGNMQEKEGQFDREMPESPNGEMENRGPRGEMSEDGNSFSYQSEQNQEMNPNSQGKQEKTKPSNADGTTKSDKKETTGNNSSNSDNS